MNISLAGPQGSGKTTQAKILAHKLRQCFINTGGLIREYVQSGTHEAEETRQLMMAGKMIDNQVTAGLMRQRIQSLECQGGFVVDGYPRLMAQLEVFDPGLDLVLYLHIDDQTALKRLMARGREDDTEASIKERLRIFHEESEKVLEHYRALGKVVDIESTGSIEEIAQQVEDIVRQHGGFP